MGQRQNRFLLSIINVYPPYLGAGISIRFPKEDPYAVVSRMSLRFYNRNLFGTHFGGSLYSMCDPHFVFILIRHLGSGYVVWDKAASIDFVRPGRGTVTALFRIPPEEIEAIRVRADAGEKVEPLLTANVVDAGGELVARVQKRLYVRKKA